MINVAEKVREVQLCLERHIKGFRADAERITEYGLNESLLYCAKTFEEQAGVCDEILKELSKTVKSKLIADLICDIASREEEISRLHKRLNDLIDYKKFDDVPKLFKKINDCRKIIPLKSGIYFLSNWIGGEVEYVGKSICLQQRLGTHPYKNHLPYCSWITIKEQDLDYAECFYIGTIKPEYNFAPSHPKLKR